MQKTRLVLLALMAIPAIAFGQATSESSGPKWTDTSKATRTPIKGMKQFYEPDNVTKDGDTYTFKLFASAYTTDTREGEEYSVNCATLEMSQKVKKGATSEWTPPYKVLPGESLYPIAHQLCHGGPSLWQRIMQ